jgi:uncharacterized protein YndB with AHSA1/START domain
MSTSDALVLRVERTFRATPEEVFDAWTNPEVLVRWWAARPTWSSPKCEVDLRVGGRYTLRMRDDESGEERAVGGEYREVNRPHRLVYTWAWEGESGMHPGNVTVVTVDFVAGDDGTTVRLHHTGFASAESCFNHRAGWEGTLDNLATRVFHQGEVP